MRASSGPRKLALQRSPSRARPALGDPFLWALFALALVTRFVWVGAIHPPGESVFSDMARYTERASLVLSGSVEAGTRSMAWQSWGTHALLALLMKVMGAEAPWTGVGYVWALASSASVALSYRLACRVLDGVGDRDADAEQWVAGSRWAKLVGVIALLWYPHLSASGYFLSETPFCLALLVLSEALLSMWQEGRGDLRAALAAAACVALRPQSLVFIGLAFVWWSIQRIRSRFEDSVEDSVADSGHARTGPVAVVGLAVLLTLSFSAWRFHHFTGYWGGIAESANMNLTAGRCHNIVTQAFATEDAMSRSEQRVSTLDGRRVSLPGFRVLARSGDGHPLALRPALGGETIRFVGAIGDPQAHAQIRSRCYAATGVLEQLRYSVVNVSLLWVLNLQWPEAADSAAPDWQRAVVQIYAWIFVLLFLVPSLAMLVLCLRGRPAGLTLCALQVLSLLLVAAVFFGTLRVRMPYDPYAFILAVAWARERWLAHRG